MNVGDEVLIKDTKAEGIIKKFITEGCSLHGDPIERAEIWTTVPGHYIKKNMRLIVDIEDITLKQLLEVR